MPGDQPNVYIQRALFGGAIQAEIPQRFLDVSDAREVPDHQEFWSDPENNESIMIEINEGKPEISDADCAHFFFNDLAEVSGAVGCEFLGQIPLGTINVPQPSAFSCGRLCVGTHTVRSEDRGEANYVIQVLLAVLRLPQVNTDVLLIMHTPTMINPDIPNKGMQCDMSPCKER
ncbi:multicopy suppressor of ts gsp1 [Cymbomonas tetramitiformis]|uniref:Multicopy suppressor of ts gsp1 n=1 Tax=Cymbomonas tetramitiformis TaxID=36881 RepID=A0AAE0GW75_9CHLO|nr:multicopy suppressor of ts gsp1 [Cymbomonas tetramitiformis]